MQCLQLRVHVSYTRLREYVFISYGKREMDTWIKSAPACCSAESELFPQHAFFRITSSRCSSYCKCLLSPTCPAKGKTDKHFKVGHGIQVLGYTAAVIIAIRSGKPADMQRLRASPPWMKREHRRLFSNNALHLKRCLGRTCHARHFNPQRPLGLNTYSTVPIHVPCAH